MLFHVDFSTVMNSLLFLHFVGGCEFIKELAVHLHERLQHIVNKRDDRPKKDKTVLIDVSSINVTEEFLDACENDTDWFQCSLETLYSVPKTRGRMTWQFSSIRLRMYSLFQKYRARSAT